MLRARWLFIVIVLALGVGWTVFWTLRAPVRYESTATLFVSAPQSGISDALYASWATKQRARSYSYLATDSEVLRASAARLGPDYSVGELYNSVSASSIDLTLLLDVNARSSSPERAQQILEVVTEEMMRVIRELEMPEDGSTAIPVAVSLASKPSISRDKVEPDLVLTLGTGIALAALAALVGAIVREVLDVSITSGTTLKKVTGSSPMTVLPRVPQEETDRDLLAGSTDAFRVLRTSVQFADLNSPRQTILVTSALPQEGKTYVAVRLAASMAAAGRSVVLLDADMRHPGVAEALDLDNAPGLTSVLLGRTSIEEAVQRHSSGMEVMTTGPLPPNPAEVLDTPILRDAVASLQARYDVVIIDSPSLLPVADPAILASLADGVLLVSRYGLTTREQVREALQRLAAVSGRLYGAVLNDAPARRADGYGYGPYGTPAQTGVSAGGGRRVRR